MTTQHATIVGIGAILLWSTVVGLVREVSQSMGPVGGAATIYTVSAFLVLLISGRPKIRTLPRAYLVVGGLLFVLYEMFLALALGYATTNRQAIEVAILNYLWPSLIVLFAIVFNKHKANWLVVPGLVLSVTGICQVLAGEQGFHFAGMLQNMQSNPVSYVLAFVGALLWATYCTVAVRLARGQTGVTLFLLLTALALWVQFLLTDQPPMRLDWQVAASVGMAALAIGYGYAAWNVGIIHGNAPLLATVSYFTPVLSAAVASFWLNVPLTTSFWKGALMVCMGSLLCWKSQKPAAQAAPSSPSDNPS